MWQSPCSKAAAASSRSTSTSRAVRATLTLTTSLCPAGAEDKADDITVHPPHPHLGVQFFGGHFGCERLAMWPRLAHGLIGIG